MTYGRRQLEGVEALAVGSGAGVNAGAVAPTGAGAEATTSPSGGEEKAVAGGMVGAGHEQTPPRYGPAGNWPG